MNEAIDTQANTRTDEREDMTLVTASPGANFAPVLGVTEIDDVFEGYLSRLSNSIEIRFNSNPFSDIEMKIFAATNGRTGSNFLCQKLQTHGAKIRECFHPETTVRICRNNGLRSLGDYCEFIVKRDTRSGVFGVKGSLQIISPLLLAEGTKNFAREWRCIYLMRKDVLKQAVSRIIAQKSGAFMANRAGRAIGHEDYDGLEIYKYAKSYLRSASRWEMIFDALGMQPHRITYEDLAADSEGVVARACKAIGLKGEPIPDLKPPEAALKRQASPLNQQWEARFREERPDFCAKLQSMDRSTAAIGFATDAERCEI